MAKIKSLDIIVPAYNEADCIQSFFQLLKLTLGGLKIPFNVIFVNDGSKDDTQNLLLQLEKEEKSVQVIELSRNFGHQAAITCGIDASTADWVITMDGDGEHSPEKIPELIRAAEQGFDLVMMRRDEGQKASLFKRATSDGFYRLISRITNTPILPGVGDFRLMNRNVVNAIKEMKEYHRFLRGMFGWLGFKTAILPYTPAKRLGGKSKYSLKKCHGWQSMPFIHSPWHP